MKKFLHQMMLLLSLGGWCMQGHAAWDTTTRYTPLTKPTEITNGMYVYFRDVCNKQASEKVLGADFSYKDEAVSSKHIFKVVFGEQNEFTGEQMVYLQNVENQKWFSGTASGWTVDNQEESMPITLGYASKTTGFELQGFSDNLTGAEWLEQGGDESLTDNEIFPSGKEPVWKWRSYELEKNGGDALTLGMYSSSEREEIRWISHIWGWDSYASCRVSQGTTATNPWYAYEALYVDDPIGDLESLVNNYTTDSHAYIYRAGTDPGCIADETVVTTFNTKLQEAADLVADNYFTDETKARQLVSELKAARTAMENAPRIEMREGFFYIVNGLWNFEIKQQFEVDVNGDGNPIQVGKLKAMYDVESGVMKWNDLYETKKDENGKETLAPKRSRYYLFSIRKAKEPGYWVVQNVQTARYLNGGDQATSLSQNKLQTIQYAGSGVFYLNDKDGGSSDLYHAGGHSDGAGTSGSMTTWNGTPPTASSWRFLEITDRNLLDSIRGELAQNTIESALKTAISQAKTNYENGFIPYITSKDQLSCNAPDPSEGKDLGALIDKNTSTYFHSSYQSSVAPDEDHYLQAKLPEAVNHIAVSWYKRTSNHANRPTRITVMGSVNGTDWTEATVLPAEGDTLPWGATTPQYQTELALSGTYNYLRFVVNETTNASGTKLSNATTPDASSGMNNKHPFFTFSEFQLYPGLNSDGTFQYQTRSMAYREDMKEAYIRLKQAIEAAEGKTGHATQADVEAIEEANKAFDAIYPDTTLLDNVIATAETYYDEAIYADGSDLLGTYNTPSVYEGLMVAVTAAKEGYDKATATRAFIDEKTLLVQQAIDRFIADINMPKMDTWYHIINAYNGDDRETSNPYGTLVYAGGKSIKEGIAWGGDVATEGYSNPVYVWRFEDMGNQTFAVRNLGTGYYLGADRGTSEQYQLSDTAVAFKFAYIAGEQLSLQNAASTGAYRFIHAASNNQIVSWSASKDSPSAWRFEAVRPDEFTAIQSFHTGGINICCTPYVTASNGTISTIYGDPVSVYTLASAQTDAAGKVTEITLNPMDIPVGGIPAGTPFIITAPEEETLEGMVEIDFSIDMDAALSTEAKTENGLVGVLTSVALDAAGYGYFSGKDKEIAVGKKGTTIDSQSGYIHPKHITNTEAVEGSLVVRVTGEGVLDQLPTNSIPINKHVRVTTLDGTTIRHNVNRNDALKGLPKGIYIVDGKKIWVN